MIRSCTYIAAVLVALFMLPVGCKSRPEAGPGALAGQDDAGTPPALVETGSRSHAPAIHRRGGSDDLHDHERLDDAISCLVESRDPDAILDEAGRLLYEVGNLRSALACADMAADLLPQAVEAHHYRAAALAALGRHSEAHVAFAMALARDPDDPETLAAAADYYINAAQPKQRPNIALGLEYARRGSARAASRRRLDGRLRARLLLLESEALNDLGRSDMALERVEESLELWPDQPAALHERGVTLFSLCQFEAAEKAFLAALRESPDDPYAHYHLGLIYERVGRDSAASAHLGRARRLLPDDFPAPVIISEAEFRAELDEAIREQPPDIRQDLAGVSIEVQDLPALDDLLAVDPPFSPTIMGLFRGLPLGVDEASWAKMAQEMSGRSPDALVATPETGDVPPRAIVFYRKNLARSVRTRADLDHQIRRTLLHEIGHLRGLDEDELRRRGLE